MAALLTEEQNGSLAQVSSIIRWSRIDRRKRKGRFCQAFLSSDARGSFELPITIEQCKFENLNQLGGVALQRVHGLGSLPCCQPEFLVALSVGTAIRRIGGFVLPNLN